MNVGAILAIIFGEAGSGAPETPDDIVLGRLGVYSGNRVSITWTPTEPSLVTRIYHPDSTTLLTTKSPGTSYAETGLFVADQPTFWLVHSNGGVESVTPLMLEST